METISNGTAASKYAQCLLLAPLAFILSSCFPGPGFFEQEGSPLNAIAEVKTIASEEKTVGVISASSTVTQKLKTADHSELSGVELIIPPGSLQIDMTITLEEAMSLSSGKSAAQLGVSFGSTAGKAVNLSNDQGIHEIPASAPPMTLQIPVSGPGLYFSPMTGDVLVTFMRQTLSNGDCLEQIFPPEQFSLNDGKIQIDVRRFGAYQPLYMPPMDLNRLRAEAKDGVISIHRAGCRIVTKKEEKSLPPVSIRFSKFNTVDRVLFIEAKLSGDEAESCYLIGKDSLSNKDFRQQGKEASFKIDFKNHIPAIDARFLVGCDLKSGRSVETAFRRVQLEALSFSISINYDDRVITVLSNVPKAEVKDCRYIGSNSKGSNFTANVADPRKFTIDLSALGEVDASLVIECKTLDNKTIKTASAKIYLPPFPDSMPPSDDSEPSDPPDEEPTEPDPPMDYPDLEVLGIELAETEITADSFLQFTMQFLNDEFYTPDSICFTLEDIIDPKWITLDCSYLTALGNGYYSSEVLIPSYLQNNVHYLSQMKIFTSQGSIHYFSGTPNDIYYDDTNYVPIPYFALTGSTPDITAPILNYIYLEQSSVEVYSYVRVFMELDDDYSGIETRSYTCMEFLPLNEVYFGLSDCQYLNHLEGNLYFLDLYVPDWLVSDIYYMSYFMVVDRAGNIATYIANENDSTFQDSNVPVVFLSIYEEQTDFSAPMLLAAHFSQEQVTPGDVVQLIVEVEDDPSGAYVRDDYCYSFRTINYDQQFEACPSQIYNIANNTFEIHLPISSFVTPDSYYLQYVYTNDYAGNMRVYNASSEDPPYYLEAPSVLVPSIQILQ